MRINAAESLFVAVDYQEKLMPVIHHTDRILKRTTCLIEGLKALDIPLYMTTQYAKGLGFNVPQIRELIGDEANFDKTSFGIYQDPEIKSLIDKTGKRFILIAGVESHICVLQSLIDLKEAGYVPVLVTDCSGSRFQADHELALIRAQQEGILLTTVESILYELALSAKHPAFKQISSLVKGL